MINEQLQINWTVVILKQRHVEDFSELMKKHKDLSAPKYRGEAIRAAIEAKWFSDPVMKPEDVDEMDPIKVIWIAEEIANLYQKSMVLDPK